MYLSFWTSYQWLTLKLHKVVPFSLSIWIKEPYYKVLNCLKNILNSAPIYKILLPKFRGKILISNDLINLLFSKSFGGIVYAFLCIGEILR